MTFIHIRLRLLVTEMDDIHRINLQLIEGFYEDAHTLSHQLTVYAVELQTVTACTRATVYSPVSHIDRTLVFFISPPIIYFIGMCSWAVALQFK